ncbi:MAG TPA: acetylornithine transaminase [Actinopolymorphaceae bacterium]
MTSRYADLAERFDAALMPTYGTPPVALAKGEGCVVWDVDGHEYLDFIAGIAVSALGHAHPALVSAVATQVAKVAHTSNLFINEPAVLLAEKLVELLGRDAKVFLTNSGTEANEAALKLVRLHGRRTGRRGHVVAAVNGFHGRSTGALAITGKDSIREPFGPFGLDVTFVPYGDPEALAAAVTEDCVAVFLEPTLGEGGVLPPPEGYLATARRICDDSGAALVLDEIQSGIGRTGSWFAHQQAGVVPDVVTLAKGLGGGLPIGACIGIGEFADVFGKGDHGSTFGGNPVSAAAALAVLETIESEDLLAHVAKVGDELAAGLSSIRHPLLAGVRGTGLWQGAVLREPAAAAVQTAAQQAGFLVNAVRPDVVRIAPPLIVTATQVKALVEAFPVILQKATAA